MAGDFGERLKTLRESLGLSQKEFAEKLGVHWMTISRYELGKSKPKWEFLKRIVETFNVNPIWLSQGKGDIFLVKTIHGASSSLYKEFDLILQKHGLPLATFVAEYLIKQVIGSERVNDKFKQRLINALYNRIKWDLRITEELLRDTLINALELLSERDDDKTK